MSSSFYTCIYAIFSWLFFFIALRFSITYLIIFFKKKVFYLNKMFGLFILQPFPLSVFWTFSPITQLCFPYTVYYLASCLLHVYLRLFKDIFVSGHIIMFLKITFWWIYWFGILFEFTEEYAWLKFNILKLNDKIK